MKFRCRHCGMIFVRDMRFKISKLFMTKRGYKSFCEETLRHTFLVPVKK